MGRATRVRCAAIFGLFAGIACGKASDDGGAPAVSETGGGAGGAGSPNATGGSSTGTGGADSAQVAGSGGAPTGTGGSDGGQVAGSSGTAPGGSGGVSAGTGGSGAGGIGSGASGLPPANEAEVEILAPLFGDDSELQNASGAALVELAQRIGRAHGYALCRCALFPTAPPSDLEQFSRCVSAEFPGALRMISTESRARCVAEEMATVPGFEDYLRCSSVRGKTLGRGWLAVCSGGMTPSVAYCAEPDGTKQLDSFCGD